MIQPALFLLDTNTVSYIANGRSEQARIALKQASQHSRVAVSAVTEGELLYGMARNPHAVKIRVAVYTVLANVEVLPWDSSVANVYGTLRAKATAAGTNLSPLDTLIAAHAVTIGAVLVTHDKAFLQVDGLRVADWATDL